MKNPSKVGQGVLAAPAILISLVLALIVSSAQALPQQSNQQTETQIDLSPVFKALQTQTQRQGEPSAQAQYQGHPQYPGQHYPQQQQQGYNQPQQPGYPQPQPPVYNQPPQQPYLPPPGGYPPNQQGFPNQQQPGFHVPQAPSLLGKSCLHTLECDASSTVLTCFNKRCECPSREQSFTLGKYPLHTMWDPTLRKCMSVKGAGCDVHFPKTVYCQQGLECKPRYKDPVGKCEIPPVKRSASWAIRASDSLTWAIILFTFLGLCY